MAKRVILLSILLGFFGSHYHHAHAATASEVLAVNLINKERSKHGLSKLKMNTKLNIATKLKLKDMQDKKYWSHSAPDGTSPFHWIDEAQYAYHYAGENLVRGVTNINGAMLAWMASPAHRKNILNPAYRETGITVVSLDFKGTKRLAIINMFGSL